MPNITSGRIAVPANPEELLKLASDIYAKHQADGSSSFLNNLEEGFDWSKLGPKIDSCANLHNQAEKLKGQMEATYRNRDAILEEISEHVRCSKNLLKGRFQSNPKKLAEWGFAIDDIPRIKPKQTEVV